MLPIMLATLLFISPGQSEPPRQREGPTTRPGETAEREKKPVDPKDGRAGSKSKRRTPPVRNLAVRAMDMVIEEAEFKDVTFEDFVEWLGRTTKANVVVRWKVLEKAGVERDRPINITEKSIKLRKLLPLVFVQATEDLRDVELAAKAEGNTLMISTKADINVRMITRVYEVQDLLVSVPDFGAGSLGGVVSARRIGDRLLKDGGWEKCGKPDAPVQELIGAITTHIQPLSWKVNGGKGTIRYFQGRLVINNNMEVHEQLASYLGGDDEPEEEIGRRVPSRE